MSYKNKTYVCFDADKDMNYYNLLKAWNENEHMTFEFRDAHEINNLRVYSSEETIKRKLRERLENTKVMIVLIGESTKNLYTYVKWEIEYAIENNIPIIAVNLNGKKSFDKDLCPPILRDKLAIHIPFGQKIMNYALNNWPNSHINHKRTGGIQSYYYLDSVYNSFN